MEKAIPTDLSGARLIYYYGKVGTEISICSKVSFDFLLNGALPTLLLALFFFIFFFNGLSENLIWNIFVTFVCAMIIIVEFVRKELPGNFA